MISANDRAVRSQLLKLDHNLPHLANGTSKPISFVPAMNQPAGVVAPIKSLKTNIGVVLAISLNAGGRFQSYFHATGRYATAFRSVIMAAQHLARTVATAATVVTLIHTTGDVECSGASVGVGLLSRSC